MGTDASIRRRCWRNWRVLERGAVKRACGCSSAGWGLASRCDKCWNWWVRCRVQVAELLPEVVACEWCVLSTVNGLLLEDARVEVSVEDVFHVIARAPAADYDAILLSM